MSELSFVFLPHRRLKNQIIHLHISLRHSLDDNPLIAIEVTKEQQVKENKLFILIPIDSLTQTSLLIRTTEEDASISKVLSFWN